MKTNKPEENTKMLLNLIASHLSTRKCCKGKEYVLTLSGNIPKGYSFNTEVQLFPDKYHRKSSDKSSAIFHILKYHMPYICNCVYEILESNIVPGTYVYRLSIDKKRRKWVRLE